LSFYGCCFSLQELFTVEHGCFGFGVLSGRFLLLPRLNLPGLWYLF